MKQIEKLHWDTVTVKDLELFDIYKRFECFDCGNCGLFGTGFCHVLIEDRRELEAVNHR